MKHYFMALLVCASAVQFAHAQPVSIHSAMMESTFAIVGKGAVEGQLTLGTGFVVGRPFADADGNGRCRYTLVTANHVLEGCQSDFAILQGRRLKEGTTEEWELFNYPFKIRDNGKQLWTKHTDVDLAAMYVPIPDRAIRSPILTSVLFTDPDIRKFELGPGTELLCLGYPHGRMSKAGFPILRSGMIASYPIVPTKETKGFLFDFNVFPGNSGGPVYLYQVNPVYEGKIHQNQTVKGIVGVVTSQLQQPQLVDRRLAFQSLGIGEVIHASFIVELIDTLPEPSAFDEKSDVDKKESDDKASKDKEPGEKPAAESDDKAATESDDSADDSLPF